jgi:hypothetical protein
VTRRPTVGARTSPGPSLPSLARLTGRPRVLTVALLVAACGSSAPARGGDSTAHPAGRGGDGGVVSAPAADSVRVTLDVPPAVRERAPVAITLRVENVSPRAVELYLRGRTIAFDVVVTRADGRVAWRRLEDAIVPAVVQLRALAPGEALVLRAEWDQRTRGGAFAGVGRYAVRGLLLTDRPEPMETPPLPLEITPGRP